MKDIEQIIYILKKYETLYPTESIPQRNYRAIATEIAALLKK